MWYRTEEEAEKACREKEKEFIGEKFFPLQDIEPNVWWAQRLLKREESVLKFLLT